jgi:hypothetical protein
MAKLKETIFPVSGTVGEYVFVDSKKYGRHIRRRVQAGSKKNEPALKKTYKRTKYLNRFASGINSVIEAVGEGHKDTDFYPRLLKRFRAQPLNKKYLLLVMLRGMDVNARHNFQSLRGHEEISVNAGEEKINVEVKVLCDPRNHSGNVNGYCYGAVLLSWNKSSHVPKYQEQYTKWMPFNNAMPEFEFSFPKMPGMVHWMLCLRKQLGFNKEVFSTASQAMRIIEVGTYDERQELLLKKRSAEPAMRENSVITRREDNFVRIEPKKKS